jgi:hypothetical protein
MAEVIESYIDDCCEAKIKCDWCGLTPATILISRLNRHVCNECYLEYHKCSGD